MREEYEIKGKKRWSLIVAYFMVAILGFSGAFWTTNFLWMMLLVVPSVMCVIISIWLLRMNPKENN